MLSTVALVNATMYAQPMNAHTIIPNDLVRLTTIAQRLHVTKQAVNNWITRTPTRRQGTTNPPIPFPPRALTIDGADFWHWPTVQDWAVKSGKATA